MKRILFVDDDSRVLAGIRRLLYSRRGEWRIDCVASPVLAMDLLAREHFHVVISDLQMPGIDGASLLEHTQRTCPAATRIVLSGQGDPASAARVARVAHMFLSKPCGETALVDAIQRALEVQDLLGDERLRGVVGGIGALPAAPRLYRELEVALAEQGCDLDRVAAIIECDAAICAKVLQVANSAFFGVASKVHTVRQAVGYLGLDSLRSLVLVAEVQRMAEGVTLASGFDLDEYQCHSLGVATLAREFVHGKEACALAFTVGILHDVGELLLASHAPAEYERLRAELAEHELERLAPAETLPPQEVHARLGAALLAMWGLPAAIVDAVRHHHELAPERSTDPVSAAEAVALSEFIEQSLKAGPGGKPLDELARIELRLERRGVHVGSQRLREHLELTAGSQDVR
ncbi:MAG: HDOD domain-containing protein [Planctomycetaceae bacterium]|nr:HDOD domain-containing protein [Planctomycetaceae bacterium]